MVSIPNIPSPAVDAFIAYAAQTKLARFVSAGTADPRTLLFGFNLGEAAGTQGIGVRSVDVC